MPNYRVIFTEDLSACFEECNGESRPLTEAEYADNTYLDAAGDLVPYADYLRYYGNPDRHVYLQAHVERQCDCCGCWKPAGYSLSRIDLMDDSIEFREVQFLHGYTPGDFPPGYLTEICLDLLAVVTADEPSTP